ncbi:MAG: hypothetical protein WAV28_07135 [Sedimentisphaerales bacterium]|jgi:hypothetical protein
MLKAITYILNFEWLAGVSIGAAKNVFLALYVLIGVLVLLIPNDYIFQGMKKRKWWLNLKLWALGDLAFIFITYYIF